MIFFARVCWCKNQNSMNEPFVCQLMRNVESINRCLPSVPPPCAPSPQLSLMTHLGWDPLWQWSGFLNTFWTFCSQYLPYSTLDPLWEWSRFLIILYTESSISNRRTLRKGCISFWKYMSSWRVNWLKMLCISEAQARDSDQTQTWNKLHPWIEIFQT